MSVSLPGFSSPAAGFDAPLDMMSSCHDRMRRQCRTLARLAQHVASQGADAQAREAAAGVLRYFDTAAVHHHADEERDLFPALLESMAGSDAVCLRALTEGLAADHRRLEALWRGLRAALGEIAQGVTAALPETQAQAFIQAYQEHLQREDDELLPLARRLLGDDALRQLGQAMQRRRNPS